MVETITPSRFPTQKNRDYRRNSSGRPSAFSSPGKKPIGDSLLDDLVKKHNKKRQATRRDASRALDKIARKAGRRPPKKVPRWTGPPQPPKGPFAPDKRIPGKYRLPSTFFKKGVYDPFIPNTKRHAPWAAANLFGMHPGVKLAIRTAWTLYRIADGIPVGSKTGYWNIPPQWGTVMECGGGNWVKYGVSQPSCPLIGQANAIAIGDTLPITVWNGTRWLYRTRIQILDSPYNYIGGVPTRWYAYASYWNQVGWTFPLGDPFDPANGPDVALPQRQVVPDQYAFSPLWMIPSLNPYALPVGKTVPFPAASPPGTRMLAPHAARNAEGSRMGGGNWGRVNNTGRNTDKPRPRKEKEDKRTPKGQAKAAVFFNAVTEIDDFIEAGYKALPGYRRANYNGLQETLPNKIFLLGKYISEADPEIWAANLIYNGMEDRLVGKIISSLPYSLRQNMGKINSINVRVDGSQYSIYGDDNNYTGDLNYRRENHRLNWFNNFSGYQK